MTSDDRCGAWMPRSRAACTLRAGHKDRHRSADAARREHEAALAAFERIRQQEARTHDR